MKKTIIIILLGVLTLTTFSQNEKIYNAYYSKGLAFYQKNNYLAALTQFNKSYIYAVNTGKKNNVNAYIGKCIAATKQQQIDLQNALKQSKIDKLRADSALNVAKIEKLKADILLIIAQQMQLKVETEMFDKAVKEHFKDWKGYANYDWTDKYDDNTKKGLEILNKKDSLDLSNNALLRLPKEVAECPNLKHINLLGNNDIDWKDCFTKVKATGINSVYVTVNDLSDIDSSYCYLITGIEILKNKLQGIPENILQQEQLTYLDLSAEYSYPDTTSNNFSTLPPKLFELRNLKYLNLNFCSIDSLPPEIWNLTNLTELYLSRNQLSSLPPKIGNLTNLTELDLAGNKLSSLPPEIGNLTNLRSLNISKNLILFLPNELRSYLGNLEEFEADFPLEGFYNHSLITELDWSNMGLTTLPSEIWNLTNLTILNLDDNQLTSLPPEIGNLTNLEKLDLRENNFSHQEKQKIETWFEGTGCYIRW